jgi:hypothetical protein
MNQPTINIKSLHNVLQAKQAPSNQAGGLE